LVVSNLVIHASHYRDLSNNHLSGFIPPELSQLQNMVSL